AFNEAYADDMRATFSKSFTHFRDSLKAARGDTSLPFDDQPIKAFGKAIDETTEKAEKFKKTELHKWFDEENKRIVEQIEDRAKVELDWFDRTNKQIVKDIEARAKAEQDFFKRTNESIIRDLEKRGREYERMSDNITRSITDGLMRGFENGKSL